jgi:integrase
VRLEAEKTKNDEVRTVYLDHELKQIFVDQLKARKTTKKLLPYVFPNKARTNRIKNFQGAWKTACKDAKIGKRVFHDFRRTAVRNMVRAGIPEGVAMKISGHKTRSVFDRYNIVNDADLQLAAQRQELYLKSKADTVSSTVHDFITKKRGYP